MSIKFCSLWSRAKYSLQRYNLAMPAYKLEQLKHDHDFAPHNHRGETRTLYVVALTAVTMVVEIVAGAVYGSMALQADGWHMGTHVAAFMITLFAYQYARRNSDNPAYSFGTGKVNVLGGFASAVGLAVVALVMVVESCQRLLGEPEIHFNQAIAVAAFGLVVNVISAFLLQDDHHHGHSHGHGHDHDHHHHSTKDHHHSHHEDDPPEDQNLHAAYLHVLADALTSVLAIVALLTGKFLSWYWLDPAMGLLGATIIVIWALRLVGQTAPTLLDASLPESDVAAIKQRVESEGDCRISDFHAWRISGNHYAVVLSLVSERPRAVEDYKALLAGYPQLVHVSVEVHPAKVA